MAIGQVYHERQSRQLCALHVLNNLFQDRSAFTQRDLDDICLELSPDAWINPHKSVLGWGNYDINVIMAALQKRGYETKWFDKRRDVSQLAFESIFGLILNVPSKYKLFGAVQLPLPNKHWLAVRKLAVASGKGSDGVGVGVAQAYFNLDSNLKSPERIGTTDDLVRYLQDELSSPDKELLIVVTKDVAEQEAWLKSERR